MVQYNYFGPGFKPASKFKIYKHRSRGDYRRTVTSTPEEGLTVAQQAAPRRGDESVEDDPTTFINEPSVMDQLNNKPNTEGSDIRLGQNIQILQTLKMETDDDIP